MLPRVRTVLLLGLPLLFSLGGDAAAQVGRLGGTVAYATPVHPTVAVDVRVVAVDDYGQAWETRTDGNGVFVMVLREGRYRVVAQGTPGYVTYGEVWGYVRTKTDSVITPNPLLLVPLPRSSSPALSRTTTLHERTPTVQQDKFALEMAALGGYGSLTGNVIYMDTNRPARGVTVVAVDDKQQSWQKTTDDNGKFVLVLPEGKYRVVAQGASGYVTYGNVWGYVRAGAESEITPNPLPLGPQPHR